MTFFASSDYLLLSSGTGLTSQRVIFAGLLRYYIVSLFIIEDFHGIHLILLEYLFWQAKIDFVRRSIIDFKFSRMLNNTTILSELSIVGEILK
jgi:hypothetical protein